MLVRYRGGEGMLAWAFHRISGVAIWLFVMLHVLDIFLVGAAPDVYDSLLFIYATPARHRHGVAARRGAPVPRAQRPAHRRHGLLAAADPLPPPAVVPVLGASSSSSASRSPFVIFGQFARAMGWMAPA